MFLLKFMLLKGYDQTTAISINLNLILDFVIMSLVRSLYLKSTSCECELDSSHSRKIRKLSPHLVIGFLRNNDRFLF